jgi:hypothetical protein
MALKKAASPTNNPGDTSKIYTGDWNDVVDAISGLNPENLRFVSEGGNDITLQDAGGNITINLATGKVIALGNLSGDHIDNYLPLQQKTAGAYIAVYPTGKLYLDGGGDTYILESIANVIEFYVGGVERFRLHGGSAYAYVKASDLLIDAAKKIYLDGGTDTYIHEAGANVVDIVTGATRRARFGAGGCELQVQTGASDPAAGNINDGYGTLWKNTASGNVFWAVNDGGTVKKVQLT